MIELLYAKGELQELSGQNGWVSRGCREGGYNRGRFRLSLIEELNVSARQCLDEDGRTSCRKEDIRILLRWQRRVQSPTCVGIVWQAVV